MLYQKQIKTIVFFANYRHSAKKFPFQSIGMYNRKLSGIITYASKDETLAVMIEKVGCIP